MYLSETLTKQNFWNEKMEKYPTATKAFCDWIDEYKKAVGWDKLFNAGIEHYVPGSAFKITSAAPKFHELPHGIQKGIWMEFVWHYCAHQFEQMEHPLDTFILEDDIESMFESLEPLLKD